MEVEAKKNAKYRNLLLKAERAQMAPAVASGLKCSLGKILGHIVDLDAQGRVNVRLATGTGRRCYGIELSPDYCGLIVARWEQLTGKKAELVSR